jgi:transcriptional regulator with XRE-family HTH domain
MDAWSSALRTLRRERRLTQAELAMRAGVSTPAVRAYESGARRPSRDALEALARALGLPGEETERLLLAGGYAPETDGSVERFGPYTLDEIRAELSARPWPAYVSNQAYDLVEANTAWQEAIGVDLAREFLGFGERNLIVSLSQTAWADRIENWDALVTFLIGLAKGDPRRREDDDRPLPWLEVPFRRFLEGDAAYIRRFFDLWESAPPISQRLRQTYEMVWRAADGTRLRFLGTLAVAEAATELHWNDWTPLDRATWEWFECQPRAEAKPQASL